MADTDINDLPTVESYTAAPGQTLFSFSFRLFDLDYLTVTVDGTAATYDATPADETQFSIATDVDVEGGAITFGAGLVGGETVVLERTLPIERLTRLPEVGPVSMRSVNSEFDRMVGILQDTRSRVNRAVRVPVGEEIAEFPSADDRAGMFLAFDGAGDPVPSSGTGADAGLRADLASSLGSTLVSWLRTGIGAVTQLVSDLFATRLSVLEMIPRNLHAGIRDGSNGVDLTPYIVSGLANLRSSASWRTLMVDFPAGDYRITTVSLRGLMNLYLRALGEVNVIGTGGTYMIGDDRYDQFGHESEVGQDIFTRRLRIGGSGGGRFNFGAIGAYTKAGLLLQNFVDWRIRDISINGSFGPAAGAHRITIDAELSFCGAITDCDIGYPGAPGAGFDSYGIRLGSDNCNIITIGGNRLTGGGYAVARTVGIRAQGQAIVVKENDLSAMETGLQLHAVRGGKVDTNYFEGVKNGIETTFQCQGLSIDAGYFDIQAGGTALKLTRLRGGKVRGIYAKFTGAGTTFLDRGTDCVGLSLENINIVPASPPATFETGTFFGDDGVSLPGWGYMGGNFGFISFAKNAIARDDPYTLDCYSEERLNLEPVFKLGANVQPINAASSHYHAVKVGRVVTVNVMVLQNAATVGFGNMTIEPSVALPASWLPLALTGFGVNVANVTFTGHVSGWMTTAGMMQVMGTNGGTGARAVFNETNMSGTSEFEFSFSYLSAG